MGVTAGFAKNRVFPCTRCTHDKDAPAKYLSTLEVGASLSVSIMVDELLFYC